MEVEYELKVDWPALAWLAAGRSGSNTLRFVHGPDVELADFGAAEAVWDGPFEDGDFDRTDIIAGSGLRLRGSSAVFVSAGSTVDRLQYHFADGKFLISNSLPCLLAAAEATVSPCYTEYYPDFASIIHGLNHYKSQLATSAGRVELVYFHNVEWDGRAPRIVAKPDAKRDFSSYDRYVGFLRTSMERVAQNMRSGARSRPLEMLGTLSSGYDSTTVSVLAKEVGSTDVLCFDQARKGDDDSGVTNAHTLGLTPHLVGTTAWRQLSLPEIPFIAANAMGEEVRLRSAEQMLRGRVLMTGYHGDKIWDKNTKKVGPDVVRGDPSGGSLTEYRLWAGFLHCPVPFWGVRQIADIVRISNSAELEPWDVPGDYSRPICRRIGEEAGLARDSFGVRKLAASVMLHDYEHFLTSDSIDDYLRWVHEHRDQWRRCGRRPPWVSRKLLELDSALFRGIDHLVVMLKRRPYIWRAGHWLDKNHHHHYLRSYVFPWALERSMERYPGASVAIEIRETGPGKARPARAG